MIIRSTGSTAENSQSQISDRNDVSFQHIMFQGGFGATAIIQSARMLLTVDRIFQAHRPLIARDSAKITEIATYFEAEDASQVNFIGQ